MPFAFYHSVIHSVGFFICLINTPPLLAIFSDNIDVLFAGEVRLDAILIHGVDNMSTKDVFAYFGDFAPGSVEWIDDSSCKSLCQYSQSLLIGVSFRAGHWAK